MKGIVFTEFLEMVEKEFGLEIIDQLMSACPVHSKGAYTKVGTYNHEEILSLVSTLGDMKDMKVEDLVQAFGKHLLKSFLKGYPMFFKDQDTFSFLKSLDSYIHQEVKKLYSDAELPKFEHKEIKNSLIIEYTSQRPFADLAEGLIDETIKHFNEEIKVKVSDRSNPHNRVFQLEKRA